MEGEDGGRELGRSGEKGEDLAGGGAGFKILRPIPETPKRESATDYPVPFSSTSLSWFTGSQTSQPEAINRVDDVTWPSLCVPRAECYDPILIDETLDAWRSPCYPTRIATDTVGGAFAIFISIQASLFVKRVCGGVIFVRALPGSERGVFTQHLPAEALILGVIGWKPNSH